MLQEIFLFIESLAKVHYGHSKLSEESLTVLNPLRFLSFFNHPSSEWHSVFLTVARWSKQQNYSLLDFCKPI